MRISKISPFIFWKAFHRSPNFLSLSSLASNINHTFNSLSENSTAPSGHSAYDFLKQRNLNILKQAFLQEYSPSRIWECYTDLINVMGHEKLPLEIHQEVLRRCTPSSAELRPTAAHRQIHGMQPANPHIHERRFQTVIRNIRADDARPSLDDYHFILEQFAAVGHHVGSMHVYKELVHLGWQPRSKTFGLCLQAIAHRLTLPSSESSRCRRVFQTRLMLADLMSDMQKLGIPFTSVNLDLTIRILKETLDLAGFEMLMKLGYGIDLTNSDCPPLEFFGKGTIKSVLGFANQTPNPKLQKFSTAALNTAIDFIGQSGDISKLIQTFEVLTQPLPSAVRYQFASFDDEDDFGITEGHPSCSWQPPHARPNTTTYNMLLRHICNARHATLARHYLNEVRKLDRVLDSTLRRLIRRKIPWDQIYAPCLSINRETLLPVFGLSNRTKDIELMRWLLSKIPKILKRKRLSLAFYCRKQTERQSSQSDTAVTFSSSTTSVVDSALNHPSTCSETRHLASSLDSNLKPTLVTKSPARKNFDIDLHVRLLKRDLEELEEFSRYADDILARNIQRVKERLSRRIWADKDVFLSSENKRVKVKRDAWRQLVQFHPRRPRDNHSLCETSLPNSGQISTFFSSNRALTLPNDALPSLPDTQCDR